MGEPIRAPAAAVKAGRERGPSVSERRAKEQAAEAAEAATKKAKKISVKRALGEALRVVGAAATGIVYGRVRLHSSPHAPSNGTGEEQRNALLEKGWGRRTVLVHGVSPSGDAAFEAVDDVGREVFAMGEQGAQEHEEAFMEYLSGNFDDAGSEVRSLDYRDRKVGHFGDWLKRVGHGEYIRCACMHLNQGMAMQRGVCKVDLAACACRWVQDEATQLWRLEAVHTEAKEVDGVPMKSVPLVPRAIAIMEYAIKAAVGHPSVPKGGDAKYMSGPWYKSRGGKRIGEVMMKKKKFGTGAYSDQKCRRVCKSGLGVQGVLRGAECAVGRAGTATSRSSRTSAPSASSMMRCSRTR